MTHQLSSTTWRVMSTLACTSFIACGGGGGGVNADTVAAAQVKTSPSVASLAGGTADSKSALVSAANASIVSEVAITSTTDIPSSASSSTSSVLAAADAVSGRTVSVTPTIDTIIPKESQSGALINTQDSNIQTVSASQIVYGSYLHPYAINSLWNARPVKPVFGTFVIPKSSYFPSIASGAYSTGVFQASSTDKPMTVVGSNSSSSATVGVADPDSAASRVITIPRWPAGVLPATGTDGHADIVDPVTNTIHSFWQLKQVNGRWTAALYSWSNLSGTGWGDPAHYYQGARATGIPASAGLIRKHEIKDGLTAYTHALAMSLTYNALSNGQNSPAYVFPATSADSSLTANTGSLPEGALLMLPPGFDSSGITNPDLRKIVETLKTYGAYIVDRNDGTPFAIFVENDSGFNLMPKGWDNAVASQLDLIRASLRQVVTAQDWIDSAGNSVSAGIAAQQNMSLLSMRGPWYKQSGTAAATYETATQSLVFDATSTKTVQVNANNTGLTPVKWAVPIAGAYVKFSVVATGGATLRIQVKTDSALSFDSYDLANGQSVRFNWPANAKVTLIATSGTNGASSVKADLIRSP